MIVKPCGELEGGRHIITIGIWNTSPLKVAGKLQKITHDMDRYNYDNLLQDLADRSMSNPVDPVLGYHSFQERQPVAAPELPNDQPY